MSAYWLGFLSVILVGFAIPEGVAITNKQTGDTLSENVRLWLKTSTPGGGWTFAGVWLAGLLTWGWFLGHILRWWS